jgi:hypothetical protein
MIHPVVTNRPLRRWAAALLNLLFLIAWGEPVSLHPCPMHDGVVAAAATSAGQGGHAHQAPAADHGGEAHAVPADGPSAPEGAAHACQCLGTCSVSTAVALPGVVAVAWQATIRHAAEPPLVAPATPRAAAPRLLPFANGPPSLA